ncbi:hypothetical protein ACT29I_23355, partial [Saccharicrinis sp. GN24d3]
FHLEAVQTMAGKEQSLSDWYADIITGRKTQLLGLSSYLVADAWFAKRTFVDQVTNADMHLISRLRDDAHLRYLHQGEPTGKRGRPKKYDGKVDNSNIDLRHFELVSKDQRAVIHSAIVYSISLKRSIKVVHALYCNEKGKQVY